MTYLDELGSLAIASRLKNLTEKLAREMLDVYREVEVDFEPRWFTFVHLLQSRGPQPITRIARELDQSHPAANQVANALEKKGLVRSRQDKGDRRKRIVELTSAGQALLVQLEPVWAAVRQAVDDLLEESAPDFLDHIRLLERRLEARSSKERILERLREIEGSSCEIIPFSREFAPFFRSLNEEWLQRHFRIEAEDEAVLSDPENRIIAKGGTVVFIRKGSGIIGTGALLRLDDNTCELTKMAVTPSCRGRKLGRRLLDHLIGEARRMNFKRMILLTSPKLGPAVSLYRSSGFRESEQGTTGVHNYERCSIFMELDLNTSQTK